jgi:hypothetical protein
MFFTIKKKFPNFFFFFIAKSLEVDDRKEKVKTNCFNSKNGREKPAVGYTFCVVLTAPTEC